MTMTTTFVGSENIAPETWLEERRFRVRYRCERCGKEFSRTYKIVPKNDPACPSLACGAAAALVEKDREIERLRVMLESGQAPAHIGANNLIKATDLTAKITMEDYNLTDLRDNIREGEPVAPKLPPEQQRRADSYFGGGDAGSVPVLGESSAEDDADEADAPARAHGDGRRVQGHVGGSNCRRTACRGGPASAYCGAHRATPQAVIISFR